jgi:DNA polymerase-1
MNFQNIPRKDKLIKAAIQPKLDALFFFDYKSIEPRLTAWYLKKIGFPEMGQMFWDNIDIYVETAKPIVRKTEINEGDRDMAKVVFLSQTYGGGIPTLIAQLEKTPGECMEILRRFHGQWPGLGWETTRKQAEPWTLMGKLGTSLATKGYIETMWGRRLSPESPHKRLNVLIQGGAADLMRSSLIKVHKFLVANECQSHIVSTIHDEIMLDVSEDEIPFLLEWVPELMRYYPFHDVVPMEVDVEFSATTWAEKDYWRGELRPAIPAVGSTATPHPAAANETIQSTEGAV